MLYVLGASMPVFMLALVPGNDFQMLWSSLSTKVTPDFLLTYLLTHVAKLHTR